MTDSQETASADIIISYSTRKIKANQVILYSFKSIELPLSADESSRCNSITSFLVEKRMYYINMQKRAILNFILGDETMYSEDQTSVKNCHSKGHNNQLPFEYDITSVAQV